MNNKKNNDLRNNINALLDTYGLIELDNLCDIYNKKFGNITKKELLSKIRLFRLLDENIQLYGDANLFLVCNISLDDEDDAFSFYYERVDGVERNPEKMQNVLRSLARNISTQVSNATLEGDVKNNFDDDISRPTLTDYLNTLEKLFVIEDVNATNLNFRSKYALRTKPKKYFVDPSIATAILEMKPSDLIKDLNVFEFMFESLCMRDLKIYTESHGGDITFYRDEKNFEVDAILRTSGGKWGAIEIKLGAGYIDEAANNLLKFKERVDIDKCGEPSFLMVLTGADYSYKRDDGVYVVSIGTLKINL